MNTIIKLEGMSCKNCVAHVSEALGKLKGVDSVEVSLKEKQALLNSSNPLSQELVVKTLDDEGYDFVSMKIK